jgi:hypothetical protein
MYSGTTLTKYSGRLFGTHQKIDRVAHKHLKVLSTHKSGATFPHIKQILHFEGRNGPDGIKAKSAGKDEPWHFYDPFDPEDTDLLETIERHYKELVKQLKDHNMERAAFEASWLAHAMVDGLTPAHHYPYSNELVRIRGDGLHSRDSVLNKLFIKGHNLHDTARRNWSFWGAKGLFLTHGLFELGVSAIMVPVSFKTSQPTKHEFTEFSELGISEWFKRTAREIALLNIFERFYDKGWTPKLAQDVRLFMAPRIIKCVAFAWHSAALEADEA